MSLDIEDSYQQLTVEMFFQHPPSRLYLECWVESLLNHYKGILVCGGASRQLTVGKLVGGELEWKENNLEIFCCVISFLIVK